MQESEPETEITLEVNVTDVELNSATITATGTASTGETLNYTFTLSDGQTKGPGEGNIWNISGLTAETTYTYTVKAETIDGTYNVTREGSFTTAEKANSSPILTAYDYKETADAKTTEKFTIAMMATDEDAGDTLTYTLKVSTSQNGTYYTIGTITGTSGVTKTIPVTTINGANLEEYGQYWWKVEVTDGNGGTDDESGNLHTYCSGKSNQNAAATVITCNNCNATRIYLFKKFYGKFCSI